MSVTWRMRKWGWLEGLYTRTRGHSCVNVLGHDSAWAACYPGCQPQVPWVGGFWSRQTQKITSLSPVMSPGFISEMAAVFKPTTCVWGGDSAPPAVYTRASANNNTGRCQSKKHFMPGHRVFTPGCVGPPRCLSPLDIPGTSGVTHQIITGTLWWGFYFPSVSHVFLLDGN